MKIYHNPKCNKSRKALAIVNENTSEFEIIEYLKDNLNVIELEEIIAKLGISPMELVRKKEQIWIKNYKYFFYLLKKLTF